MKNSFFQHPEKVVLSTVDSSPFQLSNTNSGGQWEEWGLRGLWNTMVISLHPQKWGGVYKLSLGPWVCFQTHVFLVLHSLIIVQNLKTQVHVRLNPNHSHFSFPFIRMSPRFNLLPEEIGTETDWCYGLNVSQFVRCLTVGFANSS